MRFFLVGLLVLLTACGGEDLVADVPRGTTTLPPTSPTPTATPSKNPQPSKAPAAQPGTEITTFTSDYGPMLFDATGQAIYLFDLETSSKPACYDECAEAWPPVLTRGEPAASGQVRQGLLGTTKRSDGTTQVTYAGHPLYFYAHEGKRQVLCHNIREYGGLWLVVQPDGGPAPS